MGQTPPYNGLLLPFLTTLHQNLLHLLTKNKNDNNKDVWGRWYTFEKCSIVKEPPYICKGLVLQLYMFVRFFSSVVYIFQTISLELYIFVRIFCSCIYLSDNLFATINICLATCRWPGDWSDNAPILNLFLYFKFNRVYPRFRKCGDKTDFENVLNCGLTNLFVLPYTHPFISTSKRLTLWMRNILIKNIAKPGRFPFGRVICHWKSGYGTRIWGSEIPT